MAYDSQADRLLYAAGDGLWLLNLAGTPGWSSVPGAPPPNVNTTDRAVFDPVGNRLILVTDAMDVWALDLANPSVWYLVAAGTPPPPRSFFAAAHDGLRNRLLIFGGGPYTGLFNDVWALPLSGASQVWTQIVGQGAAPTPRWGPVAAYDPVRDRLIVGTGSSNDGYAVTNDAWALSLDGSPTWTQLTPTGTPPPSRMLAGAMYDPASNRVLLYGGFNGSQALGDVQGLSLQPPISWNALGTDGAAPAGRWTPGVVARPSASQMIVFGGFGGGAGNDVSVLSLPGGSPVIHGFQPAGGRIGDPITILGANLQGTVGVQFNGTEAPIHSSQFSAISTEVPPGATTGPISVQTAQGSAVSSTVFFVGETPIITSATPSQGKIGATIVLVGDHFTGTTRVSFGPASNASFTVDSDEQITAVVDLNASTGPVRVSTLIGTGISTFDFTLLPFDNFARIMSVLDVRNDEGGRVLVRWVRSDFDDPADHLITGYRLWRRAPLERTAHIVPASWLRLVSTSGTIVYWEPMALIPAAFLDGYAYTSPTLQDSTEESNPYTAFFVQALTADPLVFYNSPVDSGYSVDNKPPGKPPKLTTEAVSHRIKISWGGNEEADLWGYRLHRGTSMTFRSDSANLVLYGPDTVFVDTLGLSSAYYKLAAVDVHGNVSKYALVTPNGSTTSVAFTVTSQVGPDFVEIEWYLIGLPGVGVTVYRRTEWTPWHRIGDARADANGFLSYRDENVVPGQRVAYRLGTQGDEVEEFSDETWITVPDDRLALLGVSPNPVRPGKDLLVRFLVPGGRPDVRLRMVDVAGRAVAERSLNDVTSGPHEIRFTRWRGVAPGMYWIQLSQKDGATVAAKVVLLR